MKYIQRLLLAILLLGGASLLPAAGRAQAADPRLQDIALGRADAPVTVIEYASLTCPHCASFHANVLPALKTEYIDTGKVRLIFRDFPLDQLALAAAAMARCAGPERYYNFLEVLFAQQRSWASSADARTALLQIARLGGLSAQQVEACWADQAVTDYILKSRLEAVEKFKVESTPTLIVNDRKIAGVPDIAEFRKLLDQAATGGGIAAASGGSSGSTASWFSADMRTYVAIGIVVLVVAGLVIFMLRKR